MSTHKSKRVSNYELFFDLAVVLAIGQLTSAIHIASIGFNEVFSFLSGAVIILSIWNNEAFYYNKYGDSRRDDIYTIIALMLWIGNLALSFNFDINFLRENPSNLIIFNTMLILSYATIALQYYLKGRQLGFSQHIKFRIILQFIYLLPLVPLATGLVPAPYNNYVLLVVFIPFLMPIFFKIPPLSGWYRKSIENDYNFPHALERNHLLTILTFGESVIGIIRTYPLSQSLLEGLVIFLGMAFLFIFYMGQTFGNIDHHHEGSITRLFYAHALIIISLLFFTVGLEFLADHHHHEVGASFFIISIMLFYIGVLSTSIYNQEIYQLNKTIISQYILTLSLGSCAFYIFRESIFLMGLSLSIMNYTMSHLNLRFRRKQREHHNVPHPDPRKNLRDFS